MSIDETELGIAPDVETQVATAWGLDYDDPDEFPTQRLTPKRITTLSVVSSLAVIAGAVVVSFLALRHQPQAVTTAPTLVPAHVQALPPSVPRHDPVAEKNFMDALNGTPAQGPNHLAYVNIPGSEGAYMGDGTAWAMDGLVVQHGYQACEVLAQHWSSQRDASWEFYAEQGYRMELMTDPDTRGQMTTYMDIAGTYLCGDHPAPAAPIAVVQTPYPVVAPVPVRPGCTNGSTRISQGEGDVSTCENGQWQEGEG